MMLSAQMWAESRCRCGRVPAQMWLGPGADVGKSRRRCGQVFGFQVFGAYVTSLYWAITTLTTIGYGDICPQNRYEKIYAIFVM